MRCDSRRLCEENSPGRDTRKFQHLKSGQERGAKERMRGLSERENGKIKPVLRKPSVAEGLW